MTVPQAGCQKAGERVEFNKHSCVTPVPCGRRERWTWPGHALLSRRTKQDKLKRGTGINLEVVGSKIRAIIEAQ